jgi:hypothetical protein
MDMFLILAGALFTLIVGIASTVGETHESVTVGNPPQTRKQLTVPGRIAIACLCLGAVVTGYAGIRQSRGADEALATANATLGEANKIKDETQQLAISVWREQHPFGNVTGFVQVICCRPQITGHGQGFPRAAMNSRGERYPRALCG